MFGNAKTYDEIYNNFRWQISERYNMGVEICDRHADDPSRVALIYVDIDGSVKEYTFQQIKRYSNQLGNALLGLGLQRGDRVGIILSQRPETAITHTACFKTGIISLPLFTQFGPDGLVFRLSNSEAKVVVTDGENVHKVLQIRDQLPALRHIIVTQPQGKSPDLEFWDLLSRASDQLTPLDTHAEDPAIIIYTSGTTGNPKGALHAHRFLAAHKPAISFTHDFFPHKGDCFWTPADWAWGGGLFDALFPSWQCGMPVVAHRFRKYDPEQALKLIADHNVRNSFMPPTALKMMRQVPNPGRFKLNMRSIASGGEALGAETLEWGREVFGLVINEFWGQTEANLLTGNCAIVMPARAGSMGRPIPGHHVEVLDEDGNILPPGKPGVLAARGPDPIFFLGYWKNPEGTAKKFKGDWLLTGDVGYKDDDGYFWFQGRDDDIISSGAYRIGPTEIEECIMRHPAVALVAVVGSPDKVRGEIVKAFVKLREGENGSDDLIRSIQEHVRKHLAAYQYPREIEFVTDFPMTTTGKILRRTLRDQDRAKKLAAAQ